MRLILENIIKPSKGLAAYQDDVEVSGDGMMSGIILEKKVCPRCRFPHTGSSGCATNARKTRNLEPLQLMLRDYSKREATGHANAQFMNDLVHDQEHDWAWLP